MLKYSHVIWTVDREITSINGVAIMKGNNATITFSAVPVNDKIKFYCKLDQSKAGYKPCKCIVWCTIL